MHLSLENIDTTVLTLEELEDHPHATMLDELLDETIYWSGVDGWLEFTS